MARKNKVQRTSIAPYTKYHKSPYKYPEWCKPGMPLPPHIKLAMRQANYPSTPHDWLPYALQ